VYHISIMTHIALLDCNNFFVSCERLFRPDLLKKPVVVLSSNDGCVVARSKEIKDIGIPMGVPYFQIKDTLLKSKAVVFSSNFALYRDISRRVFEVVRSEFKLVEQYSIDESFIKFESEDPIPMMIKLKKMVEQQVGIPVSIGIAPSKTLAKYASVVAKRTSGVTWLPLVEFNKLSSTVKLGEIWGVGRKTAVRFSNERIFTVADFLAVPESVISARYGLEGRRLFAELSGHNAYPFLLVRPSQKSIMSTRSFATATCDKNVVKNALLHHLYQAVEDLLVMNLEAKTIKIMFAPSRFGEYALSGVSVEIILPSQTADIFVLQKTVLDLFIKVYKPNVPYKKAGIMLGGLVSKQIKTSSLFDTIETVNKTAVLTDMLFSINKNIGSEVLQIGRVRTLLPAWSQKCKLLSPSYTTSWSSLKSVQA